MTLANKSPLIHKAYLFAENVHKGQKRKYTGEPYMVHPYSVALIVSGVTEDPNMLCAALLHDVIEDCGVTTEDLLAEGFNTEIVDMVVQLTDVSKPSDGDRATRKAIDRQFLAKACPDAMTIKLADILSNADSIIEHGKDFAKVYMQEVELLLEVLTAGNTELYSQCVDMCIDWNIPTI